MDPSPDTTPTAQPTPGAPAPGASFDVPGGRGPRFKDRTRSVQSTLGRKVSTALLAMLLLGLLATTASLGEAQWAVRGFQRCVEPAGIVQTSIVDVSHRTLGRVLETRVRTTYRIGENEYISNNLSGKVLYWFTRAQAQRVASRYPEGGVTTVYFNPQKPEQAVIEKRLLVEHAPTMLLLPPLLLLVLGRLAGPIIGWLRTNADPSRTGVKIDRVDGSDGSTALRVRMPSEDALRYGRRGAVLAASLCMVVCAISTWFFPASVSLAFIAAITLACGALGAAGGLRRARAQLASGRVLLLSPSERTLVVRGRGRDNRDANLSLHAHEIEAVVIEDTWRRPWRWDQSLGRKRSALVQDNSTVTVRLRSGGVIPVAIWHHPRNAPEFGKWLCGALAAIERGEMPGNTRTAVQEDKD